MFIMDTRPDEIAVLQERAKFSLFLQEREREKERERERGREGDPQMTVQAGISPNLEF